jgi:hypothetical protein
MQQIDNAQRLESLAAHARLSHRHWLTYARQGGIGGRYGTAYCLDGAAVWRRRLAEILAEIKAA